jgi:hypothetical protein
MTLNPIWSAALIGVMIAAIVVAVDVAYGYPWWQGILAGAVGAVVRWRYLTRQARPGH